jgi:putative peptide zinc metalloprotease protein
VRAWEGGTVLDAVPAAHGSALDAGSRGTGTTVWPEDAGALPTADDPALALVLVPRSANGGANGAGTAPGGSAVAPTWVFPFDRPAPPGEGDNQALAVNTTDGSVAYDVSFALVWADGDTALQRNEAYAFAGCTGCRTVAVAFQVVVLVGSVDVVVPQNISAALNYACVECVTYALATQLVVSTPGPLSEGGMARLAEVWEQLRAFGDQIEGVPLAELRDRLTGFEQRILDVVRADTAPADGSEATDPTGAEPADPATATSTTGSPDPTSDPAGETATATEDGDGATSDPAQPTEAQPTGSATATTTAAPVSSPASESSPDGAPASSVGASG